MLRIHFAVVIVSHIFKVHPRRLKACLPKTFKRKHLVVTFLGEPDCCLLISQIYITHYFLSAFFSPNALLFFLFLPSLKLTYLTLFFHLFSSPVYPCGCAEGQAHEQWCGVLITLAPSIVYWTTKADHWFSVRYQKFTGWLQLYELRRTIHTLVGCSKYKMVLAMLGWRTVFFHVSGEIIYLDKICIYYTEMAIRMLA